jgi:DNA-binding transcriptional ArsR family regulator
MYVKHKTLYEARASVLKALAHPTRLWIIDKLADGERCVCEFADAIDADFSTVSKHLSVLKNAGIIAGDKRGKQVFYRLKAPCVLKFINCLEAVIKTNAETGIRRLG